MNGDKMEEDKVLKCSLCEFKPKGIHPKQAMVSLKRHIKLVHDKIKDQKCTICEFACTDYRVLARHLERQHGVVKDKPVKVSSGKMEEDKEIKCMLCDFKSMAKTKTLAKACLKNHVKRVHNKERDVKCSMCDYSTYDNRILARHMESLHGVAKDKPVKVGENGQKDIRDYVGQEKPGPSPAKIQKQDNDKAKGAGDRIAKTTCACGFKSGKRSRLIRHYYVHEKAGHFPRN